MALVKTKNFDLALEAIKGQEKNFGFEYAYILHRQGKNKEALNVLHQSKDKDS